MLQNSITLTQMERPLVLRKTNKCMHLWINECWSSARCSQVQTREQGCEMLMLCRGSFIGGSTAHSVSIWTILRSRIYSLFNLLCAQSLATLTQRHLGHSLMAGPWVKSGAFHKCTPGRRDSKVRCLLVTEKNANSVCVPHTSGRLMTRQVHWKQEISYC